VQDALPASLPLSDMVVIVSDEASPPRDWAVCASQGLVAFLERIE